MEQPLHLSNLGNLLKSRFQRLRSISDIENAILNNQQSVDLTQDGHPEKPVYPSGLGSALSHRLSHLKSLTDLGGVLRAYSRAAKSPTGSPNVRFRAARAWAKISDEYCRSSLPGYACAIDLLPRVAWLVLPVTDQHALLTEVGGIVHDAVSAAIKWGEFKIAVEWAEQGRSIVWQNMLGLRAPIDDLRARYPHLANRIQDIVR